MAMSSMISRFSVLRPRLGVVLRTRLFCSGTMNTEVGVSGHPKNPESKDEETRFRQQMLMFGEILRTKSRITRYIRNFLGERDFVEVSDRPFVTHYNEQHMRLFLRSASEFYLKQLVAGGFDRVFEMGKQFMVEGIDSTYTHAFSTCELCMTFADYYDLMKLTEDMLSGTVKKLTGSHIIKYHANGLENDPIEIDFTPPFRQMDMIDELERIANLSIPKDLTSWEANDYLVDACAKFEIKCPPPHTTVRLLDKLVGHFLEETCTQPTFIMNHPKILSPFAKCHMSKPGLTERFELFINNFELCNGCTDLNDPVVLRQRFADQPMNQQLSEDEAMALDEYCTALEYGLPPTAGWGIQVYGLPPTAGWGMCIDRLTMFLTDSQNIKEVLVSPAMKPQDEPSNSNKTNPAQPPAQEVEKKGPLS